MKVVVDLLHGEGQFKNTKTGDLPTSLALGSDAYDVIQHELDVDVQNLKKWEAVTKSCDIEA